MQSGRLKLRNHTGSLQGDEALCYTCTNELEAMEGREGNTGIIAVLQQRPWHAWKLNFGLMRLPRETRMPRRAPPKTCMPQAWLFLNGSLRPALHLSLPNSSAPMGSAYHKSTTDAPCHSMAHLGYHT